MFKKRIQQKAAQIEARNWSMVAHVMAPNERPIEYVATHRILENEQRLGHSYVTDQQLIITAGPPPLEVIPLKWSEVTLYEGPNVALVEVPGDDGPARLMIRCVGGSEPLWRLVWPEMANRAARVGTPAELRALLDK